PTAITEVTVDEYGPLTGACVAMNMGCSRSMPRRLAGTPAPHHPLVCGDASADCRTRLAWASVAALWHGRLAVREPSSPHISVDLLRRRQAANLPDPAILNMRQLPGLSESASACRSCAPVFAR